MNEEIGVIFRPPEFKEQIELEAHWSFKAYPVIDGVIKLTPEAMFWLSKESHIAYIKDLVNGDVESIERTNGMRELQDKAKKMVRDNHRDDFEESVKGPRRSFIKWFFGDKVC